MNKLLTFLLPFLLICLFSLSSCEQPLSVERASSHTEQASSSCSYTGYCYSCSSNLIGSSYHPGHHYYATPHYYNHSSCGMKLSTSCSGRQLAEFEVTPITSVYKDGRRVMSEERRLIRALEQCH